MKHDISSEIGELGDQWKAKRKEYNKITLPEALARLLFGVTEKRKKELEVEMQELHDKAQRLREGKE